jgi:hypothetical protein
MADVLIGAVAAAGSFIGTYGQAIFAVLSVAASVYTAFARPSQPDVTHEGPRMGEQDITTSTYGKGIPIGYGAVRTGGNMIWALEIEERKFTQSEHY